MDKILSTELQTAILPDLLTGLPPDLPAGYISRPATFDDLEGVVAAINAASVKLVGSRLFTVEEFRLDLGPARIPPGDGHAHRRQPAGAGGGRAGILGLERAARALRRVGSRAP